MSRTLYVFAALVVVSLVTGGVFLHLRRSPTSSAKSSSAKSAPEAAPSSANADDGAHTQREHESEASVIKANGKKLRTQRGGAKAPVPIDTNVLGQQQPVTWNTPDYATPVLDQGGQCNACYIFAAVSVLETKRVVALKAAGVEDVVPVPLSIQMAMDCGRRNWMNNPSIEQDWPRWGVVTLGQAKGCKTGEPAAVLRFGNDAGLAAASAYGAQYDIKEANARDKAWEMDTCLAADLNLKALAFPRHSFGGVVTATVKRGKEEDHVLAIMTALQSGPVAVGIDKRSFGLASAAKRGNVVQRGCGGDNVDHAVSIFGWGYEGNQPYWEVRNSWGPGWGNEGYFKVPLGVNFCGIEKVASWLE